MTSALHCNKPGVLGRKHGTTLIGTLRSVTVRISRKAMPRAKLSATHCKNSMSRC